MFDVGVGVGLMVFATAEPVGLWGSNPVVVAQNADPISPEGECARRRREDLGIENGVCVRDLSHVGPVALSSDTAQIGGISSSSGDRITKAGGVSWGKRQGGPGLRTACLSGLHPARARPFCAPERKTFHQSCEVQDASDEGIIPELP